MINWGILGLGRMGLTFANAIEETSNSKLVSIASQSGKVFKDFKNESYESLIQNKNIDAIYISTLNNTHVDLIEKILKEEKKILCEKPVSTSVDELFKVKKLILEKKIQFYEAIAYYSHPQTLELLNLINNDEIGQIESFESTFGFKAKFNPSSRLFNKSLGGGVIYDLGCYPLSFFMLLAENPEKITIKSKTLNYSKSNVDDNATAILNYNNKFEGKIHVSFTENLNNICIIRGSKGFIKINEPWLPHKNSTIEVSSNKHFYIKSINSKLSVYANQIEQVSEKFIDQNKKLNLFDIEKSLVNMKLISNWINNENN
jgi:predicted dehydrogenase